MKQLVIGESSRQAAVESLRLIADAVGSTLGPQGRPFVFERLGADQRLKPTVSKDGLTVLNSLEFADPISNSVHYFAQQAAAHSVLASGDGTTSTVVLAAAVARAIFDQKALMPQAFARQIRREAILAMDRIRKEADRSDDCVKKVAMTSANGDEELVEHALKAIRMSSAFGTVVVEKSPASRERYRVFKTDGYSYCKGYNYNNVFASSASDAAAENSPFEWQSPHVCILNGNLILPEMLDKILAAFQTICNQQGSGQKLVIFTYETSDDILNRLIVFNRKMAAQGVGVFIAKPRLSAEINSGLQIWRDLCAYTASTMIDGGNYNTIVPAYFGTCDKVRITPTQTILLGRAPGHWVETRIQQNQNIVETAESQFDKEITAIRNGELAEGLVKVEVGGGLLPDIQERADRFDDAAKAAQSCLRSGALPGCGASYIRAAELVGACDALAGAMHTIHQKIMENFGAEPVVQFEQGQTCRIDDNGAMMGNFQELGVMDAAETVCAVIKNGVELGILVATLGGYSLIDNTSLAEIQKAKTFHGVM